MTHDRCSSQGCELRPRWLLCVRAWAQGYTKLNSTPLLIQMTLVACDQHRERPGSVGDLFPEAGRKQIQSQLRSIGRAPLDFDTAEFVFLELTPETIGALKAADVQALANLPTTARKLMH